MVKRFFVGVFTDPHTVTEAVKALRKNGISIADVYTPFAVHGLDEAMGIRRSRLGLVTLFAGLTGCALATIFQYWTTSFDWPIDVGGKPGNSWPAFMPVTFEMTILTGALMTVAAFFFVSRLFWGKKSRVNFDGVTDEKFVIVLDNKDGSLNKDEVFATLSSLGAKSVNEEVFL